MRGPGGGGRPMWAYIMRLGEAPTVKSYGVRMVAGRDMVRDKILVTTMAGWQVVSTSRQSLDRPICAQKSGYHQNFQVLVHGSVNFNPIELISGAHCVMLEQMVSRPICSAYLRHLHSLTAPVALVR